MAKETIQLETPHAVAGQLASSVDIITSIAACQRVVDLRMSTGHVFRLTAKSAHMLAVALYGLSEDHAEEIPDAPSDLLPGDLVTALYRRHDGEMRLHSGYYQDQTWRVSGTKEKAPPGQVYVTQGPGGRPTLKPLEMVTFHSRPSKGRKPA